MTAAQIIVFPRGQLTDVDRATLREAGVVPVEADDPKQVVVVLPIAQGAGIITPDDLLMSALLGAIETPTSCADFARDLYRRLKAREKAQEAA